MDHVMGVVVLQRLPVRTELGRQIERAFTQRSPDHVYVEVDYAALELKIAAQMADVKHG